MVVFLFWKDSDSLHKDSVFDKPLSVAVVVFACLLGHSYLGEVHLKDDNNEKKKVFLL